MHRRLAFFKRHAVPFMSRLHTFVPICAGSATISVDLKQFVAHSNVSSVGCKYFGVPTAPGINLKRQDITCNSLSLGTRSHQQIRCPSSDMLFSETQKWAHTQS